jgi:hypothetical protein
MTMQTLRDVIEKFDRALMGGQLSGLDLTKDVTDALRDVEKRLQFLERKAKTDTPE